MWLPKEGIQKGTSAYLYSQLHVSNVVYIIVMILCLQK